MRHIKFTFLTALFVVFQYGVSSANVVFVDQAGLFSADTGNPFTELQVPATSGEEGEFEILGCVTGSDGSNFFINAAPNWDNFDLGECGGQNCVMGLFTKFSPEPNNVGTTCFWNTPEIIAAGAVLRYSGVSSESPVFNFECNTGIGNMATSPQLATPDGSMIVRIFGANELFEGGEDDLPGSPEFGKIVRGVGIVNLSEAISIFMYGEPFPESGTAGEVSLEYPVVDTNWRACTISLFMDGATRIAPIPALSELGLIILAAVVGISGLWFIRRKSVTV